MGTTFDDSKSDLMQRAEQRLAENFTGTPWTTRQKVALTCRALFDRPSPVWRTLSEASYGIYWLHQMILMPAVYLLIPWNLPIGIKFILALGGTYILCAFLTIHGLKKLPVLRRLF